MGEQVGARFLKKKRADARAGNQSALQIGYNIWGCSSVGRAPALQAGGQEFESLHLHSELND